MKLISIRAFGLSAAWLAGMCMLPKLLGQDYEWTTFAGSAGGAGFRDGLVASASFNAPAAVAKDAAGNLFVADSGNHLIRKITPTGEVSTFAGLGGHPGSADGDSGNSRFKNPAGIAVGADGFIYVADSENHTIRKISPAGEVTTFAGQAGTAGGTDGPANAARFSWPAGIACAADGGLFVADTNNHCIRYISAESVVSTFAGSAGQYGIADGPPDQARFSSPGALAVGADGTLYIADSGSGIIRMIQPGGNVVTIAGSAYEGDNIDGIGTAARLVYPTGIVVDVTGNLYVADGAAETIRKIAAADRSVSTVAGNVWESGWMDGTGDSARFFTPTGMVLLEDGKIAIADSSNHVLRVLSPGGEVATLAGAGPADPGAVDGDGTAARFRSPFDLAADAAGNVFVADTGNRTIRKISPSGIVTTFAGTAGVTGAADGTGGAAAFTSPRAITAGPSGLVYVADVVTTRESTIRKILPQASVSTLAGTPGSLPLGETLFYLSGIAADSYGNVFSTDFSAVRKTNSLGISTFYAGEKRGVVQTGDTSMLFWENGSEDGSLAQASFFHPSGVAMDVAGTLYVTESFGCVIRKLTSNTVTTLAGKALRATDTPEHRDGTGSAARFNKPEGIAVDAAGNLFIADTGSHTIRKMSPAGVVTTIGGLAGFSGSGTGVGDRALFKSAYGVAVDSSGNVYVADTSNHRIVKGTPRPFPEIVVEHPDGRHLATGDLGLEFGSVIPGSTSAPISLKIWNTGNAPLVMSDLTISGNQDSEFVIDRSGLPDTLPAGGGGIVEITFGPDTSGERTASLGIASNDADEATIAVSLHGVGNRPPVFPGYAVSSPPGVNVIISLAKLLAAASDPDGDAVSVTAVGSPPVSKGTVSLLADSIRFSPHSSNFSGTTPFSVTLTDSRGGYAVGSVAVTFHSSLTDGAQSLANNPPQITLLPDGKATVTFHGIPGRAYTIQRSTNLSRWENPARVTADSTGKIIFIDPAPPGPNGYYRLATP
jgi:sugar lactone lactonase YvrE